ncbi:MAG: hypothetical protein IT426_11910 [Pirellulales bacterium]|nr:hypothetical protein [Pirellulales bacterium]
MNDDSSRGGCAGASIAFVITFAGVPLFIMGATQGPRDPFFEPTMVGAALGSALCVSFILAALGYFAGLEGARSKTVVRAFVKGAILFACAMGVYGILAIALIARNAVMPFALLIILNVSCLVVASGALISGMAAIVVRDYRQFGRTRFFPQFTLQELMIVTTLVGIILSTLSTMVILRL